ncbi:MAG: hypothetical protein WC052_01430 [Patescibacteria group bacterium]
MRKKMWTVCVSFFFLTGIAKGADDPPAARVGIATAVAKAFHDIAQECRGTQVDPCMCHFAAGVATEVGLQPLPIVTVVNVNFFTAIDEADPRWGVVVELAGAGGAMSQMYFSQPATDEAACLVLNDPLEYVRVLRQAFAKVATGNVFPSEPATPSLPI